MGDWRLEVDDEVVVVSDDPDEAVGLEFEFELELDDDEVEWNSLAAATENAAVSRTAPVATQRFARETRPRPRLRAAGDDSGARGLEVMPCSLAAAS